MAEAVSLASPVVRPVNSAPILEKPHALSPSSSTVMTSSA